MALQLEKPEDPIAGLEVRDNAIRFAHLIKREDGTYAIDAISEVALPEGVIELGLIVNAEAFIEALGQLREQIPVAFNQVVLTIPAQHTYTYIFSFPQSLNYDRRQEALRLSAKAQLPFEEGSAYYGTEPVQAIRGGHEVLFLAAEKQRIDVYTRSLKAAGFAPIATEIHPLSIVRSLTNEETENVVYVDKESPAETTVTIFRQGEVRFVRTLPHHLVPEEEQATEIGRITAFYEAGHGQIAWEVDSDALKLISPLDQDPNIAERQGAWAACIGAAMRGLIPREEDAHISLMSVGTAEAFTARRITRLARLASNAVMGVAGFFVLAFGILAVLFMNQANAGIEGAPAPTGIYTPAEELAIIAAVAEANQTLALAGSITSDFKYWTGALEHLQGIVDEVGGITITNMSVQGSQQNRISLNGIAETRAIASQFEEALDESPVIDDANLPMTNLEKFEDIPFSVTFTITLPVEIALNE